MTRSGPPEIFDFFVALVLPPACREEVLGDLHERFQSLPRYLLDVFNTIPLVIASRIRRTTDPQILTIQAFGLYASFLAAAWFINPAVLHSPLGLLSLAIPAAAALLGIVIGDAYSPPRPPSPLYLSRAPLLGLLFALASQIVLYVESSSLTLQPSILLFGSALSLLFSTSVRLLFPPITTQLLGANSPALWLKRDAFSGKSTTNSSRALKVIFSLAAIAVGLTTLVLLNSSPRRLVMVLAVFAIAIFQLSRRP